MFKKFLSKLFSGTVPEMQPVKQELANVILYQSRDGNVYLHVEAWKGSGWIFEDRKLSPLGVTIYRELFPDVPLD